MIILKARKIKFLLIVCIALATGAGYSQDSGVAQSAATQNLPSAPQPQSALSQTTPVVPPNAQSANLRTNTGNSTSLSLKEAEALAVKNNPQVSVARLTALASHQVTREVRSALWPTVNGDLTAVDAHDNSRITAGGLNNPIIYERAAGGILVNQLITDFGRTTNLVSSANFASKAQDQNAAATKQQILLAVDQAFYGALQAQAVLTVAQQTVNARQTVVDQVQALFNSKLKSELDLSFANVNLAQAKLLILDAENNENAAFATLSMILGYPQSHNYQLVDDSTAVTPPPGNVDDLIVQAFAVRPEILSLEFQERAAQKFHVAERDLFLPDIRAIGAAGETPFRDPVLSSWYAAAGVNVDIPLFNGFLYASRSRESSLRAQAAHDQLLDLRNRISRDVRTGWLNANTAYARLSVTQQLVEQANLALDLAQTRYKLGLSSIVELSQAQLQQTQAQISNAQAGYDYRLARAVLQYQTTGF
jgi:outer membrane protein